MIKKFLVLKIFIYSFIFTSVFSQGKDDIIYLKKIRQINTECEHGYIAVKPSPFGTFLARDNKGIIYLADFGRNRILRFNENGGTLPPLGRMGSGPGEMINPIEIVIENNQIIFNDTQNRRIQIIGLDGAYQTSFKTVFPPLTLTSVDNMIYGVNSMIRQKDSLVVNLNFEGHLLKKFGSMLDFIGDMHPITSSAFIKVYNDHIYLLFIYYPILRKYDLQGRLLSEHHFSRNEYEKIRPGNYKIANIKSSNSLINVRPLFTGFQINDSGMYLGIAGEQLLIDHYDLNYRQIARFVCEIKDDNYVMYDCILLPRTDHSIVRFAILEQPGPAELPYQLNLYEARINE